MATRPEQLLEWFIAALLKESGDINALKKAYTSRKVTTWTRMASRALLEVGRRQAPKLAGACKGSPDGDERSEYLCLDVTVWKDTWGPPVFIAESENRMSADAIQYAAWKLFAVEAEMRILLAYFGAFGVKTFADLKTLVGEVARDNPQRPLVLFGGDYGSEPGDHDRLRKTFSVAAF